MNTPKWQLPATGWLGYGAPGHPYAHKPVGDRCGVAVIEMHDAIAEAQLERDGVLIELELYVAGICREYGR